MHHSLHGLLESWLCNNKGTQLLFGYMKEYCARCGGLCRFICYAPHLELSFVLPSGIFSMMCMECMVGPFGVGNSMKTFAVGGNVVM